MPDERMNVAFKLNWVYGADGPFTTACTPEGRLINIIGEGKVWCNQPECACHALADTDELLPADALPCLDLRGYRTLRFSGGTYHSGSRRGTGIAIHDTAPGKLAFLTSRRHDMAEDERIIIACFRIDRVETNEETGEDTVAAGDPPLGLRVPPERFEDAPRFWDFRAADESRLWRSGLFRYVPDDEAATMWAAMEEVCDTTHLTVLRDLEAMQLEEQYTEGQRTTRLVSHYERNPELRTAAVRIHGTRCQVCGMSFAEVYGNIGEGFIEVHRRKPVSEYEGEVQVDPATDMAAVCPNCHRMLHLARCGPLTVEELRAIVEEGR